MPQAFMVSTLSLLVHPLLVYLLATRVFSLEPQVMRSAVLTAAMAPGANAFLFASMYNRAKGVAASAILMATSASVFTASGWIWFLGT
jgi:predicted permease